jgi:para-aminobenzoate synthetase component 1
MSASPRSPLVEELSPPPDPARCCEQLEELPYRLFLDSASRDRRLGRYSFVTADPFAVVRSDQSAGDPLERVREALAPFTAEPIPGLPPFQGGAAGYLAYDWGLALERLPEPLFDDLGLSDVVLGLYDWVLAWDHVDGRAWLVSTGMPEREPGPRPADPRSRDFASGTDLVRSARRAAEGSPHTPFVSDRPRLVGSAART